MNSTDRYKGAAKPLPVRTVERIEVIKTTALWGAGTGKDPKRLITQYWTMDGKCVVMIDGDRPIKPE